VIEEDERMDCRGCVVNSDDVSKIANGCLVEIILYSVISTFMQFKPLHEFENLSALEDLGAAIWHE